MENAINRGSLHVMRPYYASGASNTFFLTINLHEMYLWGGGIKFSWTLGSWKQRYCSGICWTLISSIDQTWPWWWQVWHKPQKKMSSAFPQKEASSAKIVLEYNARLSLKALCKIKRVDLSDMAGHGPTQTKSLVVLCVHAVFDKFLPLVKCNGNLV